MFNLPSEIIELIKDYNMISERQVVKNHMYVMRHINTIDQFKNDNDDIIKNLFHSNRLYEGMWEALHNRFMTDIYYELDNLNLC